MVIFLYKVPSRVPSIKGPWVGCEENRALLLARISFTDVVKAILELNLKA